MAEGRLRLRVITPESVKIDEGVDMVIMRCTTGDMGILPRHEPCSVILDYGVLRIINDRNERRMAVFGGIAQVRNNVVTILANGAQKPEDIDLAHAEAELEEIRRHSRESTEDHAKMQRDQVTMRRTLVQIEVSAYPLISKTEKREGGESHQ
jgi:F-type H+-transporting ATPase subunit epsilon